MRFINLTLRIFGFLVALAIAVPILIIGALQVPAGRNLVSGVVSTLASTKTRTIDVSGLYLDFGLNASLAEASLSDQDGTWLNANNISIQWHPLRLLSGDLDIVSISAAQIDLNRLPASKTDEGAAETAQDAGDGGLALPVNISIANLKASEINLGEALLGAPISMTASGSGSFALDPALIKATLDVQRTDGIDGSLDARMAFEPEAEILEFDVAVSEPRGGLAARLLEVPNLPAIGLNLTGSGPLTNWSADLNISIDGHRTVTGSAAIEQQSATRELSFDLQGDLSPLVPPAAEVFLLGTTNASGHAKLSRNFVPQSAEIALDTQTVALKTDAMISAGKISASGSLEVDAGDGALIGVGLDNRHLAFGPLTAAFTISGEQSAANWSATVDLTSFRTDEARSGKVALKASGTGADFQSGNMASPFDVSLTVSEFEGLTPQTGLLSGALAVNGKGKFDVSDQSAQVTDLAISSPVAALTAADAYISASEISGQGRMSLADLSKLSGLTGRDLGGSISGSFSVDLNLDDLSGSVSTALQTTDLQTGIAQADALLSGNGRIDADLDLNGANDVTLKSFALESDTLEASGHARYRDEDLTSEISASIADLEQLGAKLSGRLDLQVDTSGPADALLIEAEANSRQIMLAGTPLDDLTFSAEATADPSTPKAVIKSSASLNGQPIAIDVELISKDGGADISPLSVKVAGNSITGTLAVSDLNAPLETLDGTLNIDAPDLASLSPLLLTDIGGNLQGTLEADPGTKSLILDVVGNDIEIPSVSIGNLKLKADVAAPYTPDKLTADIAITDIDTAATPIHAAEISAFPGDGGTAIKADVKLDSGSTDGLTLTAGIKQPEGGRIVVSLSELSLRYQGIESRLKEPTTVSYSQATADIEPLELELGNGSLSIAGYAGESIDLKTELKSVPLNLANAFVPSLGLSGTLSGTVTASGSSTSPEVAWSITGNRLSAKELKNNGLADLGLVSSGKLQNNEVSQTTKITDPNGLDVAASGTIGLASPNPLSITIDGTVPTAALKRPMLDAGLRGQGTVTLKGTVSGSVTSPAYRITAAPSDLKITGLSTGLTLQNIKGSAVVTQNETSLNGITGDLATGGTLSAAGTIGMKEGFAADLSIQLDKGRYVDPGLVTAEVDADVKISGPLASSSSAALIGGTITINKADISIPEYLPGAIPPVEVRHVNASKAIRQQIAELGGEAKQNKTEERAFPPRLDILLSAPGRIFIRGRGLDTELQGNLKVVGTTADPQAIGAFSLKRGQLDILTRRLVFSRGNATFEGSLTPLIDFAASTTSNDTTITVSVSGEADDPQIKFSSSPELPQDEILALLLFDKNIGNLSASQIASLAAAVATLTGGRDNGPLASIRKSLGLDAIDINADGEGGPSVAVGKYINDNIYLGVEQGTGTESSRVKVDIDLDRGLKIRGEVGADGSSKAGIFFEREY